MRRVKRGNNGGGSGNNSAGNRLLLRSAQLCAFALAAGILYFGTGGVLPSRVCRTEPCCSAASGLSADTRWVDGMHNTSGGDILQWRMAQPASVDNSEEDVEHNAAVLKALHAAGPGAVLIDIGAGIGRTTMLARAAGHRVVAIEPLGAAFAALNASLCAWDNGSTNRAGATDAVEGGEAGVSLVRTALGGPAADGAVCELWNKVRSGVDNGSGNVGGSANTRSSVEIGGTQLVCGTSDEATNEYTSLRAAGWGSIGRARVRALDELVREGVVSIPASSRVVIRSDVAGWEPMVYEGARGFIQRHRPVWVMIFRASLVRRAALTAGATGREARWRPAEFLRAMQNANYSYMMKSRSYDVQQTIVFTPNAGVQTATATAS